MLLKFVCVSIFYMFCLFHHTQLPTVSAAPFEYNEDHEQYPYDLDIEQSKAKYDTRLLRQEEQRSNDDSIENSKDSHESKRVAHNEKDLEMEKAENGSNTNADDNDDDDDDDDDDDNIKDDMKPHERAASCHTHEHKYTHGQKVPRLDPCEVCLCMDGEIFCWWEKCEKRKTLKLKKLNAQSKTVASSQMHELSSSESRKEELRNVGNEKTSNLLKKQSYEQNLQKHRQQPTYNTVLQQQKEQRQLQKSHMYDKRRLSSASALSSNKIMNFPENLPSVLYYDYHTEEHEYHQHQHHQEHLKHQLQKKIQKLQREHDWQKQQKQHKHHQQHQRQQEQELAQKPKLLITDSSTLLTTPEAATPILAHRNNNGFNINSMSSPAMLAYDDFQTDSDILPEPPTKKPKILLPAMTFQAMATTNLTTGERNTTTSERQKSNLYDNEADTIVRNKWNAGNPGEIHRLYIGETSATSTIFATDDIVEINKNVNENPQMISTLRNLNVKDDEGNKSSNQNDEEQDDAFHRWLTSTENYNGNNDNNKHNTSRSCNKNKNCDYKNNDDDDNPLLYGNENPYATDTSEFENPFGIQNLTMKSQQNTHNNRNNNKDNNNKNSNNNGSNKLFYPKNQERIENAENGFLHGLFNSDYSDYNGSVVNIDILLTTQDDLRQQQQERQNLQKQAEGEQLPKTPASIMFADGLILNREGIKQTVKTINESKMSATEMGELTPKGSDKLNSTQTMATTVPTATQKNVSIMTTTATTTTPTSYVQFIRTNNTKDGEGVGTTKGMPGSQRHCNVMGTLYKIGEVLPQDTGNCLQCICIDGSTTDATPRVTCSPHNCPPLVLPDLFDATGY